MSVIWIDSIGLHTLWSLEAITFFLRRTNPGKSLASLSTISSRWISARLSFVRVVENNLRTLINLWKKCSLGGALTLGLIDDDVGSYPLSDSKMWVGLGFTGLTSLSLFSIPWLFTCQSLSGVLNLFVVGGSNERTIEDLTCFCKRCRAESWARERSGLVSIASSVSGVVGAWLETPQFTHSDAEGERWLSSKSFLGGDQPCSSSRLKLLT